MKICCFYRQLSSVILDVAVLCLLESELVQCGRVVEQTIEGVGEVAGVGLVLGEEVVEGGVMEVESPLLQVFAERGLESLFSPEYS